MKRHNHPHAPGTDKLRSCGAAVTDLGQPDDHETGRWLNHCVENSHQPFRRRKRAALRFGQTQSLQKFVAVCFSVHNHLNAECAVTSLDSFKASRAAALAEWRHLCAV